MQAIKLNTKIRLLDAFDVAGGIMCLVLNML